MILHLDMDAFFASVEQLDDPFLKGKPVIVGRSSARGVVAAASYEARKYGVASAMPVFEAKRKCPQGIIVPGRMERYKEISAEIISLLREFSPLVEQVSIDEAYLDISGCESIFGPPEKIGMEIKKKIKEMVNLGCSVGIAPVKFLAKIASDIKKPDGLTVIEKEDVEEFIDNLDIRKVPGVGKSMTRQLDTLGIGLLGDVKKYSETKLVERLGKYGRRLIAFSYGIDNSPVTPTHHAKSISAENTLSSDTMDKDTLRIYLLQHAERVGRQLRRQKVRAGTVILKIKTSDFKLATRRLSVKEPTQSTEMIYQKALTLLENFRLEKKVRLIGVGVSGLLPEGRPVQMDLFEKNGRRSSGWEKVDRAIDGIVEKYGSNVVKRASVYKK
jgi:DNA polymerase IV